MPTNPNVSITILATFLVNKRKGTEFVFPKIEVGVALLLPVMFQLWPLVLIVKSNVKLKEKNRAFFMLEGFCLINK